MSKVYWDTMLFVYLLEDSPSFGDRVASIYSEMVKRGDTLCASEFTLAELVIGPRKTGDSELEQRIIEFFESGEVQILPFNRKAALQFAGIRASTKISSADAIHLACASATGVDLFLTNDALVRKSNLNGIQFIDGIQTSLFD